MSIIKRFRKEFNSGDNVLTVVTIGQGYREEKPAGKEIEAFIKKEITDLLDGLTLKKRGYNIRYKKESMEFRQGYNRAVDDLNTQIDRLKKES